jgi:MoaA/NifB/PqqE/SkfB family radical SAM enzyme
VAPDCNIQCNYCVRKYECVNESRPGVTARVLSPQEALARFLEVKEKLGSVDVVGIAGPGDALANWDNVKETFSLIRKADTDVTFCLSTNGLLLPRFAEEAAALGVSHITVTVNAVDPATARRVYRFVRYEGKNYTGAGGAEILLANQYEGIKKASDLGLVCKVNIVMLKGLNDKEIPEVVRKAKDAGADLSNIMQLIPVKGSFFEHLPMVSNAEIMEKRKACEALLPQMYHCRQCRSDAIGRLDEDLSHLFGILPRCPGEKGADPASDPEAEGGKMPALRIAVASKDGMLSDLHFGHARSFYIYEYRDGGVEFIEKRDVDKYCLGEESCGIGGAGERPYHSDAVLSAIVETLADCDGVIAMRIGVAPLRRLEAKGIRFHMTYDYAGEAVKTFGTELAKQKTLVSTI